MTNREWLESLPNASFVRMIKDRCVICAEDDLDSCTDCYKGIITWMRSEHEEPRELTKTQVREAFLNKFGDRRAISLDEIKDVIRGLFE